MIPQRTCNYIWVSNMSLMAQWLEWKSRLYECAVMIRRSWLEWKSRLYEMYCHDQKVMSFNLGRVNLGVRNTSVQVALKQTKKE